MSPLPGGAIALRSALIAAMLGCLLREVVGVVHLWVPEWDALRAVAPGTVLAAAVCLERRAGRADESHSPIERLIRLVGPCVAVVAGLQIWQDLLYGQPPLHDGWPVLNPETWSYAVLALVSAWVGRKVGARLAALEGIVDLQVPAQSTLRWVTLMALGGGLIAAGLAAVQDSPLASALGAPFTGSTPSPTIPLLYTVSGVLLVALTRHASLRARWLAAKVMVDGGLAATWAAWTLAFTIALVPVAVVLPSNPSADPSVLRSVADPALSAGQDTLLAARGPAEWLITRIGGTIRLKRAPATVPTVPPDSRVLAHLPPGMHLPRGHHNHPHAVSKGGHGGGGAAMAAGFWLAALLLLGALGYRWRRKFGQSRRLLAMLMGLRNLARLVRVPISPPLLQRFVRPGTSNGIDVDLLSDLDRTEEASRILIARYYQRFLQAAARSGAMRGRHMTPAEFGKQVCSRVPQASSEIDGLTEVFVQARYAPELPGADMVQRAGKYWAQADAALRHTPRGLEEQSRHLIDGSNPRSRMTGYADEG